MKETDWAAATLARPHRASRNGNGIEAKLGGKSEMKRKSENKPAVGEHCRHNASAAEMHMDVTTPKHNPNAQESDNTNHNAIILILHPCH